MITFVTMYYYLIIGLQGFCIYHAIKNKNNYYWIFLIFFIPLIGSIIYLITQVFNNRDVENIQDSLTSIINPTKKVTDLKKQLEFSDTFQNKVNLADAYFEIRDYNNAITYYKGAKDTLFSSDFYVISRLMESYFYTNDYNNTITCYTELASGKEKINAQNQMQYGLTLDKLGKTNLAEKELKKIDISFSNYDERLIFAEFLMDQNKNEDAKIILQEVYNESKHFTKDNRRIYKQTIKLVKSYLNSI